MADYNMVMSQADISTLKDTLRAQQQLLQRLYNELDAEREASASAASETLSVILRLQGEKASIKMESEHYKRLAEEKMCHAEESLEIIEDIIYQKEMEVSALNYQVQAYRHKLLSMGCVDPGIGEVRYPENHLQRNEALGSDKIVHSIGRRNSAPVSLKYKKFMAERATHSPENDLISKIDEEETGEEINEQGSDSDKKIYNSASGSTNSYMEQIKKLDERVLEIAGASYTNFKNEAHSPSSLSSNSVNSGIETRSPSPQLSIGNQRELKKVSVVNEIDKRPANMFNVPVDYPSSSNIYDVFEVPQVGSHESVTKIHKRTDSRGSEKLGREHVVHPEAVKLFAKDEPDWLKKFLQHAHCDNSLCKPSEIAAIGYHLAVSQPSTSGSATQPRVNQLNQTSEIIEVGATNREEEMKLLNEIKEQINLLQDEIRQCKVKKSSRRDEQSLCALSEAMLYFWL